MGQLRNNSLNTESICNRKLNDRIDSMFTEPSKCLLRNSFNTSMKTKNRKHF